MKKEMVSPKPNKQIESEMEHLYNFKVLSQNIC